ncbi:FAD/NAD(P)-binding domain-containing protein [Wilcoxina mikolae CBS 423.85]|nr:FAD/NAD(P)-binding domain-containing protein [Wilcoxina mikolae CBS 423.85]
MSQQQPTLLILGASYVGIPTAHRLLRLLPQSYKIILVNPSSHLYWNVATPRAISKSHQFSPENAALFAPITPGFSSHPISRFEFVQGKATALDPNSCSVLVTTMNDEGVVGAERSIAYTHLIIATGAAAHDGWPFKALGSHRETKQALADVNTQIEAAKTIVLSGAGPTGVETAGEIATLWKGAEKKIYLLDSGAGPLPTLREDVRRTAQKQLQSLGVVVKANTRVVKETRRDDGRVSLELSDGESIVADVHIPTFGLTPNTAFVPEDMLDETKSVKVDTHLRSVDYDNIWVAGDAASVKRKSIMAATPMREVMVANVVAAVEGREVVKEHKDDETPMIVPIGGGFAMGTGILYGWKPWGLLVWLVKGRKFFIDNAKNVALGKS